MKFTSIKQKTTRAEQLIRTATGTTPVSTSESGSIEPTTPLNTQILEIAILEGIQKRRCFGYSPQVKALLAYLDLTTPRFNESDEVIEHVSAGLARKYPELWNKIQERFTG